MECWTAAFNSDVFRSKLEASKYVYSSHGVMECICFAHFTVKSINQQIMQSSEEYHCLYEHKNVKNVNKICFVYDVYVLA